MKARILPFAEWDKLSVTGMPPLHPNMRAQDTDVVVVEDDGKILGSISVLRVTHLEAVWVDPEHKGNPGLIRMLLRGTADAARAVSGSWVMAQSDNEHMKDIIVRLGGVKIPNVDSFVLSLEGN